MSQKYWAVCPPGLEGPLARELKEVGARKREEGHGGVAFEGTYRVAYRAHLSTRTMARLYLEVDNFRARDLPELYNKTLRIGWERWLWRDHPLEVRASARRSRLHHTGTLEETVAQALGTRLQGPHAAAAPAQAEPQGAQRVLVRLDEDRCTLKLDMSGALLHQRGWRQRAVAAPVRETTAAALLAKLGWDGERPLIDPMCGSGTFVIEGAMAALGVAPGLVRIRLGEGFAFGRWRSFNEEVWREAVAEARSARRRNDGPGIAGFDASPEAVEAAQANAQAAGIAPTVRVEQKTIEALSPPPGWGPGLVVCNPPYGARLQESGAHQRLVERFAQEFEGWELGLVLARRMGPPAHPGLRFERLARFENGGIPVALWRGIFGAEDQATIREEEDDASVDDLDDGGDDDAGADDGL